jgi:ArsR family transcriptional regulator, arsenate/arsenite/antimonite-responsive transcriptional repressor
MIKNNETGAGCTLVNCSDIFFHGKPHRPIVKQKCKTTVKQMTFVTFVNLNMSYNIFRFTNMKKPSLQQISEQIAAPLTAIASPQRIAILLAIGTGEACVCHLETALGWRQAYISQHLMALRKADVLLDRRSGRYIFHRLKNASLLDLITASARLSGLSAESVSAIINTQVNPACECPQCSPALICVESLKTA